MSFLDSVVRPERKLETKSLRTNFRSSFLNSVLLPGEKDKVRQFGQEAYQARSELERTQGIGGLLRETGREAISGAVAGIKAVPTTEKSFGALIKDPYLPLKEGSKNLFATLDDSAKRIQDWGQVVSDPNSSVAKKVAATGSVGVGWLNNAFTVFSSPLAALSPIPGIGHIADSINKVFGAIGGVGEQFSTEVVLRNLPVSEKTKKEIEPLIRELGSLSALVLAGKAGADVTSKITKRTTEVTSKIKEDIKVQVQFLEEGTTKVPIKTPSTKQAEYARSMGYEPYTPAERLPIIKYGKRQKTTELTVKLPTEGLRMPTPKGTRLVPEPTPRVKGGFLESVLKPQEQRIPTAKEIAQEIRQLPQETKPVTVPAAEVLSIKPIESVGEMKESRLAAGVEEMAIERRLTEGFEGRPEYAQVSMKEQARQAEQLRITNPEQAIRIALGEELAPSHLIPEAVFIAVERAATRAGDVATLKRLATGSSLSLQATAMGQRIRTLGERDQLSPVKIMEDVRKVREEAYEKKTGKKVEEAKRTEVAKMKEEMKKSASKRQDWESFISELKCNY